MGWMSRILGRDTGSKGQTSEPVKPAVVNEVQYHVDLVPEYLATHKELIALFGAIGDKAKQQDFAAIPATLIAFKTSMESHLLSENVRFYSYLEQQFKREPENHQLVKSFRVEMRGIARQVVEFIRKWKDCGVNAATLEDFQEEYRQVGEVLSARIGAEEKDLYPLYQPPK